MKTGPKVRSWVTQHSLGMVFSVSGQGASWHPVLGLTASNAILVHPVDDTRGLWKALRSPPVQPLLCRRASPSWPCGFRTGTAGPGPSVPRRPGRLSLPPRRAQPPHWQPCQSPPSRADPRWATCLPTSYSLKEGLLFCGSFSRRVLIELKLDFCSDWLSNVIEKYTVWEQI